MSVTTMTRWRGSYQGKEGGSVQRREREMVEEHGNECGAKASARSKDWIS